MNYCNNKKTFLNYYFLKFLTDTCGLLVQILKQDIYNELMSNDKITF